LFPSAKDLCHRKARSRPKEAGVQESEDRARLFELEDDFGRAQATSVRAEDLPRDCRGMDRRWEIAAGVTMSRRA